MLHPASLVERRKASRCSLAPHTRGGSAVLVTHAGFPQAIPLHSLALDEASSCRSRSPSLRTRILRCVPTGHSTPVPTPTHHPAVFLLVKSHTEVRTAFGRPTSNPKLQQLHSSSSITITATLTLLYSSSVPPAAGDSCLHTVPLSARFSIDMQSPRLSESLTREAQANIWQGPASPPSRASKSTTPSTRAIKRKPAPKVPLELLQEEPTTPVPAQQMTVLQERSLNLPTHETDAAPKSASPIPASPARSQQQPQKQYILDIDAPADDRRASTSADASVQELLRSATLAPSSAAARSRKGPLRWMHDKDEHAPSTSTSSLQPRQPALSRKTSISAQLKLSLRRNKVENQPAGLVISAPTNFVHLSTGTEGAYGSVGASSLRRSSTTSAASRDSSLRSSVASISSASSFGSEAELATASKHVDQDKALYSPSEKKHPLRPLKSIRRPSKLTLQDTSLPPIPAGTTSPKDKRKAIYAAPGSVPAILEPTTDDMPTPTATASAIVAGSPGTSPAGAYFAATLDRTLGRARLEAENGSPEPELSRSPSSAYDSSAPTSKRSSLASLHQFSSFLDFPDMPALSRTNSGERVKHDDPWSALQPHDTVTAV
ncbi:uncharacterized protein PSANT_02078 [Moesziomyces antarcticus]|uniref:Uncharacterized protein n=1 Tax=Pseudozyma antarctica TaxID=84753 RepID=A0A5C3FJ36_PSEA2|nr:uncharacterized protein PSANT_02078 [Moesziomyces antarcticus]